MTVGVRRTVEVTGNPGDPEPEGEALPIPGHVGESPYRLANLGFEVEGLGKGVISVCYAKVAGGWIANPSIVFTPEDMDNYGGSFEAALEDLDSEESGWEWDRALMGEESFRSGKRLFKFKTENECLDVSSYPDSVLREIVEEVLG